MFLTLPFLNVDPIIFQIGPIAIRWYSLAYIAGLVLGCMYMRHLARRMVGVLTDDDAMDFITWATLGVILGGRVGYILFYKFSYYLENPLDILYVWQGGMSFHGGFLGVVVAGILFVRRRRIAALRFADLVACSAPIGLFFGRIANYINSELYGRVTDVPWATVFPTGGPQPRHPSQLYEALLEGLVLFVVVNLFWRMEFVRSRPGFATGIFILGYAAARSFVELFRQPDAHLGFLLLGATMGQWLSLPMVLVGLYLIIRSKKSAS
ncbi:MAG: prolipoprotein diacylglyceryl transferase [Rhodospirillales bacterium]|nr:prolipoprotein diacylglyceryl transferase [Rhodospirillales bacterium]